MRKRIKGQDTLEFVAVLPLFLLMIWLLILLATQWHAYHVTVESALEAASRSANALSVNMGKAQNIANDQASFAEISIHNTEASVSDISMGHFLGFKSQGWAPMIVGLPWGTSLDEPLTNGYTQAPVWAFQPCDDACQNK